MKRYGLSVLLALTVLSGCGDGGEKEAQKRLQKAEIALQQDNFSEAKLQIDSIKVLYPKAFEAPLKMDHSGRSHRSMNI